MPSVEDLPPYPKGNWHGKCMGFAFLDGKRYKMGYSSEVERAWCECSELCDEGLWEEAEEKFEEYQDLCESRIDERLASRVICGRNKSRSTKGEMTPEQREEAFRESFHVLSYELSRDMDRDPEGIIDRMYKLVEDRELELVPEFSEASESSHPDYENTSTDSLVLVCNHWLAFCRDIYENEGDEDMLEMPHEKIALYILPILAKRKLLKVGSEINEDVLECAPESCHSYDFFLFLKAEFAEVRGELETANETYKKLLSRGYDGQDTGLLGDDICIPGSISERIFRTQE